MGKDKYGHSGGWSATGTMRNNGISAASHLQANFLPEVGRHDPSKNYTVQFTVGPTKNPVTKQIISVGVNAIAEIKWSVEGNDVRRLVSVANGVSLTGVGEAVRVAVFDRSIGGLVIPADYDVSITVAPGSRPSLNKPVTLASLNGTSFGYSLLAGTSQVIAIPQDAGIISTYVTVADTTAVKAPIANQAAQVAVGGSDQLYDPRDFTWVPIVPGALNMTLFNNSAAQSMLFNVTFGIDG